MLVAWCYCDIDRARAALRFKVLCLGAGESGKSTVIKQLRLIHVCHLIIIT
jgi:GTPase SAR1 family protein